MSGAIQPMEKQKREATSALVADVAVQYRLLKGSSNKDTRLAIFFLVPKMFAEAMLTVLEGCIKKELEWFLGYQELSAKTVLNFPDGLVNIVPTFPALLENEEEDENKTTGTGLPQMEEADAVEILKSGNKGCLQKRHVIYHVYDHKRPHCSWKAALFISKDDHLQFVDILKEMVASINYDFGECFQVLDVELWSEANARKNGISDCPFVTDAMIKELEKDVARKKDDSLDIFEWHMEFCHTSSATFEWNPAFRF